MDRNIYLVQLTDRASNKIVRVNHRAIEAVVDQYREEDTKPYGSKVYTNQGEFEVVETFDVILTKGKAFGLFHEVK